MLAYLQDGACEGDGSCCQCCLRGDLANGFSVTQISQNALTKVHKALLST